MYVVVVYDISLDEKGTYHWKKIFQICCTRKLILRKFVTHFENFI